MRIQAQGKYLQSILEKAKETLASHTMESPSLEAAHAELSELATKVTTLGMFPSGFSNINMPGMAQPDPLMALHPQPRQPARNSDASPQKSFLNTNAEDNKGVSGSGDPQGASGRQPTPASLCISYSNILFLIQSDLCSALEVIMNLRRWSSVFELTC